jgi:hypothetical protein
MRERWRRGAASCTAAAGSSWFSPCSRRYLGRSLLAGGDLRNVPFRDTEAGRTNQLIRDEFPRPTGAPVVEATSSFVLIFTSMEGLDAADPRFFERVNAALAPLRADPRVFSIFTPDNMLPASAAALRSRTERWLAGRGMHLEPATAIVEG